MDQNTTKTDDEIGLEVKPSQLISQAEALFDQYSVASRVIRDLNFPTEELPDNYRDEGKYDSTYDFDSMLRVSLYRRIGGFSQEKVVNRIEKYAYLKRRFKLDRVPRQQTISHTERRRFSLALREFLDEVAEGIKSVARDKGVSSKEIASPDRNNPDPQEVAASNQPVYKYVDQHAPNLISRMLNDVAPAFDTNRADNAVYDDTRIWEQQLLMSLTVRSGTPSAYRIFNKFCDERPHNDTHVRAVKMLGTPENPDHTANIPTSPDDQKRAEPEWRKIADAVGEQFNEAVSQMLNSVRISNNFTEPGVVAIDVTGIPYHVTPWKGQNEITSDDESIVIDENTGRSKVPKDDYPEMVNGTVEDQVYEYQYATLTIVGRNIPIVLAVEPIRHRSDWESDDGESVSWAEVVDRLMEKATELVDIHLVMADKAFDQHGVYHVLDQRHDVNYVIPKKQDSKYLRDQAEEVHEDPVVSARVEKDAPLHFNDNTPYVNVNTDPDVGENNYSHDVTFMHVPACRDDWIVRNADDTGYALFVTNRDDISPLDAEGLTNRYSDRWDIENEYRMIHPLIPSIASKDYRMRFFSFVFSTLLYNLWRIVDHSLKEIASEAYDDYGRGPHENRLDTILALSDFLASSIIMMFVDGLDPPDVTL